MSHSLFSLVGGAKRSQYGQVQILHFTHFPHEFSDEILLVDVPLKFKDTVVFRILNFAAIWEKRRLVYTVTQFSSNLLM